MSDVRALLKAKRQETRITHPYASYTSSTPPQLKCIVCGTVVKHASAWEGHLGSKGHRMGVVRMREEEARAAAAAAEEEEEAEAEEDDGGEGMEEGGVEGEGEKAGKRKATDETETHVGKKRKVDPQTTNTNKSFPQDFFSDPSRAPALLSDDSDDDEEEGESAAANASASAPAAPATAVDLEYERFQRELLTSTAQTDPSEAYDRATVAAEPVPASADVDGFPTMPEADAPAAPAELTEEQSRLKKQEEERELIMDRLLEEERAQEDADARVSLLKAKVEALRRKRELAKASKAKKNAME